MSNVPPYGRQILFCKWMFVNFPNFSHFKLLINLINVVSKSSCFHVTKMITFVIQNSLVHLNPLCAPNRLWCLGCSTLWVFLHKGLYHFWHKMNFFEVLPKVHDYQCMLPNWLASMLPNQLQHLQHHQQHIEVTIACIVA
jgi:hypothetical protein